VAIFDLAAVAEDDGVRLLLSGDLDLAGVQAFERLTAELLERPHPCSVTVDLRALRFIDSSGLRALMIADAQVRRRGGRLVVVQGQRAVRRAFAITQLDQQLEIEEPAAAR
jgi:anti-sigma B factor antagonist